MLNQHQLPATNQLAVFFSHSKLATSQYFWLNSEPVFLQALPTCMEVWNHAAVQLCYVGCTVCSARLLDADLVNCVITRRIYPSTIHLGQISPVQNHPASSIPTWCADDLSQDVNCSVYALAWRDPDVHCLIFMQGLVYRQTFSSNLEHKVAIHIFSSVTKLGGN